MKKLLAATLWLVLAGLVGYISYTHYVPCAQPITYKIGTLDPRFGVSEKQFLSYISKASELWSNAEGKQLFVYSPEGSLTINLVYDSRQQTTQEEHALSASLTQNNNVAASVKAHYKALDDDYAVAQKEYDSALAVFNANLSAYNKRVTYWSNQGGAPQDEYTKLIVEKDAMQTERDSLEKQRVTANDLANQINTLIDKYNLAVERANDIVDTINNDGLAGTEFEEGVYIRDTQGTRINIYQYDNTTAFVRVLAHELGHALTLEHTSNPDSIMNPINQSKSLTLSPEDVAELNARCNNL